MIERNPRIFGMVILGVLGVVLVSLAIPVALYLTGY
jgi:hypothetical protein